MSNMSELDARINEAIEDVAEVATTFYGDESRTSHADGSVTYASRITGQWYPNAPSWAVFVGFTYRDGLLLAGPTFAEFRSELIEWGPLA